jgi:hypothetical protein
MKSKVLCLVLMIAAQIVVPLTGGAQRRAVGVGGAGRAQVNRGAAATSIRSDSTVNRNVNQNRDVNRNVNRDVERNIDVDRDIDVNYGYDRWGHPIAAGMAIGATAAAVTALAVGTTTAMLPPSGCQPIDVNGATYMQCGSTWYQPMYSGTDVQYTVVNPPQ